MRTRTFIGLAFLILALLVVSTPALLDPAAAGVEAVAIRTGVLEPPRLAADSRDPEDPPDPVEARLQLKGYVQEESGDFRDVSRSGARDDGARGRLRSGDGRLGLLGEPGVNPTGTPPAPDALTLDQTGCPVFPEDADLVTLLQDVELRDRYTAATGAADDPTACREQLNAAIESAPDVGGSPTDAALAKGAMLDRNDRRSLHGMVISLREITLLQRMLGDAAIGDALNAQE